MLRPSLVLRGYTLPLLDRSASFAFHLHHICIVFAWHLHCRMLSQEKAFWRDFHQTLKTLRSSTGTQVFFLSCDDNTTWTGPSWPVVLSWPWMCPLLSLSGCPGSRKSMHEEHGAWWHSGASHLIEEPWLFSTYKYMRGKLPRPFGV